MALPYSLLWLLNTAFRFFPWPTRSGLRPVGEPGPESPVLLTGNFALTVARVERALRGLDAWLLIVDSHGINVWCAAAGGHLTTHDAISALKTTGIGERVEHRQVILPQLAATGIEVDRLRQRTGWEAVWGPVEAARLPAFLRGEETPRMRQVRFDLDQRVEMAVMWAAPLTMLALSTLLFWLEGFLPLVGLIWAVTLTVYVAFPLYEPLVSREWSSALVPILLFLLLFGGVVIGGVALMGSVMRQLTPSFLLRWGGLGLGVVLLLSFDLPGTTPLYKSWSHRERVYRVVVEPKRCTLCGRCERVCPRGVFAVNEVISQPYAQRCEQCGACIVQCPTDALVFSTSDGDRIPPQVVRRHKLNLLGEREHSTIDGSS